MARLDLTKRAALSGVIRSARIKLGWSQEEASERATEALHDLARRSLSDAAVLHSVDDAGVWLSVEVTRRHVVAMENCPSAPLATPERRARLLALVVALSLDRAEVNRLAGGL